MIRNFILTDAVTLDWDDKWFDLHNTFDVYDLTHSFTEKTLSITFVGLPEFMGCAPLVTLAFFGIRRFYCSSEVLNLAEPTLAEMGFKNPDDFDHDWLLEEKMATTQDDFFLRFDKDEFLRIYCDEIIASVRYPD